MGLADVVAELQSGFASSIMSRAREDSNQQLREHSCDPLDAER